MVDVTETYELLTNAIKRGKIHDVSQLLFGTPSKTLIKFEVGIENKTLLNVAAIHRENEIMARLIENGITKWNKCKEGNDFFIGLIEDRKVQIDKGKST